MFSLFENKGTKTVPYNNNKRDAYPNALSHKLNIKSVEMIVALMQYMTDFSTDSERLNINNTVQAKRSAVTRDALYQRLGETRH